MTTNPNNPLSGGQTPPTGEPQGQTPHQAPGQTPNQPQSQTQSGKTLLSELPQDIQDLIRGLRREAKESREALDVRTQAEQTLERQRLAEQGQFKQLAEQHEARVKELTPVVESYKKLADQVKAQIMVETKDWPSEVKAFYPGDDASAEQLQDWFNRSKPLLDKLQQQARGQQPGNSPNPSVASPAASRQAQQDANRQAFVRQRNYGF